MILTADACYTRDHCDIAALSGLIHSASDCASSVQKIRQTVDALGATGVI